MATDAAPSSAIYLDHAATTPPLPVVVDAVARTMRDLFGNPSSTHPCGSAARRALEDARDFLRGTVGAAHVTFTSGGTEADVLGLVGAVQDRPPGRVLVGAADHPAVLAQGEMLARTQHRLMTVPTTPDGDIEPEALFELLGTDVRAVAILHGHNELGTLARVEELTGLVRRVCPDAHVHVDLVQAYGKVPFDLDLLDVDSAAVSGHKLHGPRGIGFLAWSSKARLAPLQKGGGQEEGLRGGTENVAGAVGLAVAAEQALTHLAATARHTTMLADLLLGAVREAFPDVTRLGHAERRLPHVLSLRIPGVVGQTLQQRLAARAVAVSTGAACHGEPGQEAAHDNHVHAAIGLSRRASREVLRVSFSRLETEDTVARAAAILVDEARALLAVAPDSRPSRARGAAASSHGRTDAPARGRRP